MNRLGLDGGCFGPEPLVLPVEVAAGSLPHALACSGSHLLLVSLGF